MKLPRGMRDFEGTDSAGIERVRREFMRVCGLYGFEHVDPSPLEYLSTLETRSGPAIRDEIYHFEDKGGRQVALRFDLTMGLARRAASQRSERLPSKVSSFGGVFRYDEPQRGRYRYFHQWDVEVFGRPTAETDAEIIEMTSVLFESLGLGDVSMQVCHRDLIESKIMEIFGDGTPDHRVSAILRAVDKTAKKSKEEIIAQYLEDASISGAGAPTGGSSSGGDGDGPGATSDTASMLGQVLDFARIRGSIGDVTRAAGDGIEGLEGWDRLTEVFDLLSDRGVNNVEMNLGIVRGLDYYSGMVFEVFDSSGAGNDDDGAPLGALAGGGRYDALTSAFGRDDLGAAGVAGGVERIVLAMRRRGILDDRGTTRSGGSASAPSVAVLYATPESGRTAARIASALRRCGIAAEFDIAGRGLKKQLGNASQRGIGLAIIAGLRDVDGDNSSDSDSGHSSSGLRVALRKMEDGTQHVIGLDELFRDPHAALGIS